jgi:WD40 repeat protein
MKNMNSPSTLSCTMPHMPNKTVKIWRPSNLRCVESFRAHDNAINALGVSSDGFVYTGYVDSIIKIWAKSSGERKHSLVAMLEKHKSCHQHKGSILYSGACDRSIFVWKKGG